MLRNLPAVNELLLHPLIRELTEAHGRTIVLQWVRTCLDQQRARLLAAESQLSNSHSSNSPSSNAEPLDRETLRDRTAEAVLAAAERSERQHLRRVINATGTVLHTSLGRAPLSVAARQAIVDASGTCNLEVDVETGDRRARGYQLADTWQLLTGCERALVVNNNAAATLLALQALCSGREVVISRGELIEIGGSFRLPDIFELSGAVLREVGTTNRTRLADYERAIGPNTAAIMRVHPSNYRVVGFAERPETDALTKLAHERGVLMIDDIGSGALSDLVGAEFRDEPSFQHSLQVGADVVLGSGDKLLGGPQCGIILGRASLIESLERHPLARAVRVDKLTLAALSATLESYLRGTAEQEIPTLRMLRTSPAELKTRADVVLSELHGIAGLSASVRAESSVIGGGSVPTVEMPGFVVVLKHSDLKAESLAQRLRVSTIRVFSRVSQDEVLLDLRSVLPEDDSRLALAVRLACPAGNG